MQIFMKIVSTNSITCEVDNTTSVDTLKTIILQNQGIPKEEQCLMFAGKQLEEGTTLEDYNIHNEATVDVVLRLRGGGYGTLKNYPPNLLVLAQKYNQNKRICRKCYARLPPKATNCRKKKCGHSNELREKKKFLGKEGV